MKPERLIFTVTAGRTGTAWLTSFIKENSSFLSFHEFTGIDDFGYRMPDIRTMRTFNEIGLTEHVKKFWDRKFESFQNIPQYAESNHTLSKCGLIEYMDKFIDVNIDVDIILLKRSNRIKQAISYLTRSDFLHVTIHWQWYLSYNYKRKLLNPKPFLEHGIVGMTFWYIFEMEVRQEYYKQIYGDRFNFIDAKLEDITKSTGASLLAKSLKINDEINLPPPKNANNLKPLPEMVKLATDFESICNIDPKSIATTFIESGERIGKI
jgi:hypothetical protein